MKIKLSSYEYVNELQFGASISEAKTVFGTPNEECTNRDGETELVYDQFILRFDMTNQRLRECTLLPGTDATINSEPIAWDDSFLSWVETQDDDLKEVLGFILSLKLGLALTGFHDGDESQKAIHAFNRGDWDMFSRRMIPFRRLG